MSAVLYHLICHDCEQHLTGIAGQGDKTDRAYCRNCHDEHIRLTAELTALKTALANAGVEVVDGVVRKKRFQLECNDCGAAWLMDEGSDCPLCDLPLTPRTVEAHRSATEQPDGGE